MPNMKFNQFHSSRLAYASFVLKKEKVLYVETPKVASSSMKCMLRKLYPSELEGDRYMRNQSSLDMCIHDRGMHALPSLLDCSEGEIHDILNSSHWLRVAIVRNPYSRLFSCWRDKVFLEEPGFIRNQKELLDHLRGIDDPVHHFREFVQWIVAEKSSNHHWQPMTYLLCADVIKYTLVARLESVEVDLEPFFDRVGTTRSEFERFAVNRSIPVYFQEVYDSRLAKVVYEYYYDDFAAYKYSEDSWTQVCSACQPVDDILPAIKLLQEYCVNSIRKRNKVIAYLNNMLFD